MPWVGNERNKERATEEDEVERKKTVKEDGCLCPHCGYELDIVAETAFRDLYECAQCGYVKQVKT